MCDYYWHVLQGSKTKHWKSERLCNAIKSVSKSITELKTECQKWDSRLNFSSHRKTTIFWFHLQWNFYILLSYLLLALPIAKQITSITYSLPSRGEILEKLNNSILTFSLLKAKIVVEQNFPLPRLKILIFANVLFSKVQKLLNHKVLLSISQGHLHYKIHFDVLAQHN